MKRAMNRPMNRGRRYAIGWMALAGLHAQACAAGRIYLSQTSDGLPSYSHEPGGEGNALYLELSPPPPPRPRERRADSPRLHPRASMAGAYDGLPDSSIRTLVLAASRIYGVPQELLFAVMHAESSFNPHARSSAGAIGLMQIMPPTGARYGVSRGLADPATNIDVGARYLRDLLDLFKGDMTLAVAAYNAGEGAVLKYGGRVPPYAETRSYVPRVMGLYADYARGALAAIASVR
jgi:soluble lytic murein transglycosylase-like protein